MKNKIILITAILLFLGFSYIGIRFMIWKFLCLVGG